MTSLGRRRRPGIKTHRAERLERTIVKRIPVTTRLRTIVDLTRTEDERTVTRALRAAKFSGAELDQLPQTGMLGRILDLSAAPTESDPEDLVLNLVLKAGLPHPPVNAPYPIPGQLYIPDLWWPAARLIVEVDSFEWHDDPLAQRRDQHRQAVLEARGECVLRVTTMQAERNPRHVVARIRAALDRHLSTSAKRG